MKCIETYTPYVLSCIIRKTAEGTLLFLFLKGVAAYECKAKEIL